MLRAQPIYQFADVIGRYWPNADILELLHILQNIYIKTVSKAGKVACTSDLKWYNQVVCPAESGPLFDWKKSEVFSVQCTDAWNKVY